MSLILDALKKLDSEKSFRRNKTVNIAVEILRPDLPRPGKRILLYFAAVSLTAVATAAITYAVMVEFGFLSKSSPPAPVSSHTPSQQVAPTPNLPEPVRDARDEISRVTPKIQSPAKGKSPTKSKSPAESKKPETSLVEKKASQNAISEEADVAPENIKTPAEPTPTESATTPLSLKLSGVVWSEEPSKRLAVINGMIATEGSVIGEVKIVEIHPTHVLLSHNGQPFEISMFK